MGCGIRAGYLQNIDRAHSTRDEIQDCNGDQLPIEPIALVPGPEFLLGCIRARDGSGRSLDPRAQETLKVLDLQAGAILAVDRGLVFDKKVKFGLGDRVAFEVDLESMSRLQRAFRGRVEGPLDIAILGFMHGRLQVKVAPPKILFSG